MLSDYIEKNYGSIIREYEEQHQKDQKQLQEKEEIIQRQQKIIQNMKKEKEIKDN